MKKALALNRTVVLSGSSEDIASHAWKVLLHGAITDSDEAVRRLPKHWRVVYTTLWLQYQVNNGGHHQFFWNSDGGLNYETLEDLKIVGAKPFVELFTQAMKVFGKHNYKDEKKRAGLNWDRFTAAYRERRLTKLDDAFYKQPHPIEEYVGEYIKSNQELYLR